MTSIATEILAGMMDAFASIISNNLNGVMKGLAALTIILNLPTIVASFYGMNVELPFAHPVYHQRYDFPKGLPKIHEHDGLPAQGLGLLWEGRLVCFYDFQCDLGDGWEDPDVHNDPPELHQKALQMGANLVQFVFGGSE